MKLVPDALEPPESVPALSPLSSSRAGGTAAWYTPALHKPRRFPPESCYPWWSRGSPGGLSGRSPSRFVHVRSPRQAGLTAGNKSRRYCNAFQVPPRWGPYRNKPVRSTGPAHRI